MIILNSRVGASAFLMVLIFVGQAFASPEANLNETFVLQPTEHIEARMNYEIEMNDPTSMIGKCVTRSKLRFTWKMLGEMLEASIIGPLFSYEIGNNCNEKNEYSFGDYPKLYYALGPKIREQHKEFIAQFDGLSEFITMHKLSADGKFIDGALNIDSKGIREGSLSGKFRIGVTFRLTECIDQSGQAIEISTSNQFRGVAETLQVLRRSSLSQYTRCGLVFSGGPRHIDTFYTDLKFTWEFGLRGYYPGYFPDHIRLSIFREQPNSIQMTKKNKIVGIFNRFGPEFNPQTIEEAERSAKLFRDKVVNEYGDLLYRLSENPTNTPEHRQEAVRAFFMKNGQELKSYLDYIDQAFAFIPLMTKLSILRSINEVYAEIEKIENSLKINPSHRLDRVVYMKP